MLLLFSGCFIFICMFYTLDFPSLINHSSNEENYVYSHASYTLADDDPGDHSRVTSLIARVLIVYITYRSSLSPP